MRVNDLRALSIDYPAAAAATMIARTQFKTTAAA